MQPRESGRPIQPTRTGARHGFQGKTSGPQRRERKFSQASLRRPLITYDQHGRPWFCEVSIRSGMPCGTLQAMFLAPWKPDPMYIVVNTENTAECFINYPLMRQEKRDALRGFHARAVRYAGKKQLPTPQRGKPYAEEIVEELGTAPSPIEPIIAAEQEHPWIIGWSSRPDPRLVELVKPKRRQINVDEEGFDFSEASYNREVGGQQQAPSKRQAQKTAEAAGLEQRVAEYRQIEEVGGVDDDLEGDEDDGETGVGLQESDLDGDDEDALGLQDGRAEREAADAPLVDMADVDDAFDNPSSSLDLDAIEAQHDPEHTGGRRVPVKPRGTPRQQPQTQAGARRPQQQARHAARPAGAKATKPAPGHAKSAGRTMAAGAKPVIAD